MTSAAMVRPASSDFWRASKIDSCLPKGQAGIQVIFFESCNDGDNDDNFKNSVDETPSLN